MKSNRRHFISTTLAGGMAAALPLSSFGSESNIKSGINPQYPDYEGLNKIEKLQTFKTCIDQFGVVCCHTLGFLIHSIRI